MFEKTSLLNSETEQFLKITEILRKKYQGKNISNIKLRIYSEGYQLLSIKLRNYYINAVFLNKMDECFEFALPKYKINEDFLIQLEDLREEYNIFIREKV